MHGCFNSEAMQVLKEREVILFPDLKATDEWRQRLPILETICRRVTCSDLLENFGGHMYAAGLTMRPENVEEFTRRFNAYVEENIDPQMLMPQVDIDSELLFSDITPAFRKDLNRFQPFGPGNTAPVFATYGVSNHGDAKLVGVECEHLRMDLIQRQKPNTKIQSIAFQQPTHYEWVRSGRPIDVCYQIVENHYRGTVTTQLRIKDIKPVMNR